MKYCDLHCDTLTVCADGGKNLYDCGLQADIKTLAKCGCAAQCFAIFTQDKPKEDFLRYAKFYYAELESLSHIAAPIKNKGDFYRVVDSGRLACILTAENIGFLESADEVSLLSGLGVKMASLVWNVPNKFACPNMIIKNGAPDFTLREQRGLTKAGKEAVEAMNSCGIYADVSHLSDGGVKDVLEISALPVVASHSLANGVNPHCRNLEDWQIKAIADSGGIVGVNFCRDFLGTDDTFAGVLAHTRHMIDVGGEDCVAFGSDFDGIPAPKNIETCGSMPRLLNFLQDNLGCRAARKMAVDNFARVFC